jgi:hypothetical protein
MSRKTSSFWLALSSQKLARAGCRCTENSFFVEGQTLPIEYRWAGTEYERFPSLAADLVHRQVILMTRYPSELMRPAFVMRFPP